MNFLLSGSIDLFLHPTPVIIITIGDYLPLLSKPTRDLTKAKLKHLLGVLKEVVKEIGRDNGKEGVQFMLKGVVLFRREEVQTSTVLDIEVESDNGVTFTFEKFV